MTKRNDEELGQILRSLLNKRREPEGRSGFADEKGRVSDLIGRITDQVRRNLRISPKGRGLDSCG